MDITKYNFQEELDNILEAINESTFLALDAEFTGLDAEGSNHNGPLDTPAERYEKLRNGSSDFLLLQVGLCAFKVDAENKKYEAKPYNFYVFPSPYQRHAPDRRFLCQTSSIDFLVANGFDFNKVFREGIPYLSTEQEVKMKAALEQKHKENRRHSSTGVFSPEGSSAKKTPMPIPEEHKEFINEICGKIDTFIASEDKGPLQLPPCNAFMRKLIYQTVEQKYPLAHLEAKTGEKKERYLVLHKAQDPEEMAKKEIERQAVEMMELDIQVGFTKVMQAVSQSGKLVVGHNMFLDILHATSHFHGPLPKRLDEFKSVMKTVFPKILDTKLLANTQPFKDHITFTALEELLGALRMKPFIPVTVETASGFDKYASGSNPFHEAGYDAFLTGCCFATMCRFLGTFQNPPTSFLLPTSSAVQPFVNKLFLMRIMDIPYLNLDGPDLEVNRDHVFHVTFPKEWRSSDLHSLFDPYGEIRISWLNECSAYVSLQNKKYSKLALDALSTKKGMFHVVSYGFHHRNKSLQEMASATKRKSTEETNSEPSSKIKCHSITTKKSQDLPYPVNEGDGANEPVEPPKKKTCLEKQQHQETTKLFEESPAW